MMKEYLEIGVLAALEAGKAIMNIYERGFQVTYKEDNSPLTEADLTANAIINRYLRETPYPIISEENVIAPFKQRRCWEACWLVDPLDGTKEFVKQNGEFTVNIALVKKEIPLLGVIYAPVKGHLYYGERETKRSYKHVLQDHALPKESIGIRNMELSSHQNPPDRTVKVVTSRSHINKNTKEFFNLLMRKGHDVERITVGSSLKFGLMAEGSAHLYPRFAPTWEWDIAAGQAICENMGVMVQTTDTGRPLGYNKENLKNPWFICGREEEIKKIWS